MTWEMDLQSWDTLLDLVIQSDTRVSMNDTILTQTHSYPFTIDDCLSAQPLINQRPLGTNLNLDQIDCCGMLSAG